jgi:hypothetical protein
MSKTLTEASASRVPRFILQIDAEPARPIQDANQLSELLSETSGRPEVQIALEETGPAMKGFERFVYRLLGLSTGPDRFGALLLLNNSRAALSFTDSAGNETRATNTESATDKRKRVEFKLATGEKEFIQENYLISREDGVKALLEYFQSGSPPKWLTLRKSR